MKLVYNDLGLIQFRTFGKQIEVVFSADGMDAIPTKPLILGINVGSR